MSVAESPWEMEHVLSAHNADGNTVRMAAGYCWPWSDPRKDGSLVADVQIDDWSRPWNLRGDRAVGGAPPSALWATDPAGSGQVGCVYTAQRSAARPALGQTGRRGWHSEREDRFTD